MTDEEFDADRGVIWRPYLRCEKCGYKPEVD